MKIIRESNGLANLFPQYYSDLSFEDVALSHYTYLERVIENRAILFSFVSDAIFYLTKKEADALEGHSFKSDSELFKTLRKNGLFINKNLDEISLMLNYRASFDNADAKTLKVVILPTTSCNARCSYCCGAMNLPNDMTMESAQKAVETIVGIACDYERVQFGWYGGEPLLKSDIITFICEEVRKRLPDIQLSSYLISNTSLLDERIIDKMVKCWNVKRIGITFDGIECEHNFRKNYKDSSINGFNQTITSIQPLLDQDILVQCRFNADKNNISQLKSLLNSLQPYLKNEHFIFYVAFLNGEDSNEAYFEKAEYNSIIYEIGKIYKEFGMASSINNLLFHVFTKWCQGKSKNSFTIGPDGRIYKCNLVDLEEKNSIGSIFSGIEKNSIYYEFMDRSLNKKCQKCKFLPICQGGCPANARKQSKSISQCNDFRFSVKGIAKVLADYYE